MWDSGRFPADLGTETHSNGSGSKNAAERTQNQPRRPILRPFRGNCLVRSHVSLSEGKLFNEPRTCDQNPAEILPEAWFPARKRYCVTQSTSSYRGVRRYSRGVGDKAVGLGGSSPQRGSGEGAPSTRRACFWGANPPKKPSCTWVQNQF